MRAALSLSVCLLTLIGCASPQPAAPPTNAVAATPAATANETDKQRAERLIDFSTESGEPINTSDGQKLVCKKEGVTNTRLKSKKICLTPEQWQARTNNAKDAFREAVGTGNQLPPKGN